MLTSLSPSPSPSFVHLAKLLAKSISLLKFFSSDLVLHYVSVTLDFASPLCFFLLPKKEPSVQGMLIRPSYSLSLCNQVFNI